LERCNSGEPLGNKLAAPLAALNASVVDPTNVPEFLSRKWEKRPEIALLLDSNGAANSVLVDWSSYGLIVGPTNFDLTALPWKAYYSVEVGPGVFAVWFDSK
jgi:hypothetical protein